MNETTKIAKRQPEPTVLFVSDSHFHLEPGPDECARLDKFLQLLDLAHGADHLVLLGDIFDFWFDYPHFRHKGYEGLLQGLDRVQQAGTKIHFIGGNHDIWAAKYFHDRYGCSTDANTEHLTLGSRQVELNHGDGMLKFDWAYNAFRAVVRTRAGILLAKSLHPEILFALSTWLSGHSRSATRDEQSHLQQLAGNWFERQKNPAWDLLVIGHIHHGFVLERETRQFAALGGWLDQLNYGLLQHGLFSLLDFERDPHPTMTSQT